MITKTSDLDDLISRFSDSEFVAVDTEFIRETTYYPKLCLVQLSNGTEACCIDPLASDIDLSSLFALMENENICKVFHAGKQDMEIFVYLTGKVQSLSMTPRLPQWYAGLVSRLAMTGWSAISAISIWISSRFTNWAERPRYLTGR